MEIFNVKEAKPQKIESFDTCEHKLKLLESSLKWSNIRKTLHWLNRVLASEETTAERCRKTSGFRLKKNKNSTNPPRGTDSKVKFNANLRKRKKLKKDHISWRNGRNKKEKLKNKRKHPREKVRFRNARFYLNSLNTTTPKPNSALVDVKTFLLVKSKHDKYARFQNVDEEPEREPAKKRLPEDDSENRRKAKLPKPKRWPHFVYHRVSSQFLHPNSTGQKQTQSAYIAISVVPASKPESADNVDV